MGCGKKRFLKEFFFTGRESEGGKQKTAVAKTCEEENHIPQSIKSSSPPPQEFAAKKTIYLLVHEKVIFSTGVWKVGVGCACLNMMDIHGDGGVGDMDGEM